MKTARIITIALAVLIATAAPLMAGVAEERIALEKLRDWAVRQIEQDLVSSGELGKAGIEHLALFVGPDGPLAEDLKKPLSNAIARVDGLTEVWPYEGVKEFVDQAFMNPEEIRYNPATYDELGWKFKAAQGLLFVRYGVEDLGGGKFKPTVDLSLWVAKTAEKVWGSDLSDIVDLAVLENLNRLLAAGKIDECLARIADAVASNPELGTELGLLKNRAETLRSQATALAKIQGQIDLGNADEAYRLINDLYSEADPSVRPALSDFLNDVRRMLTTPAWEAVLAGKVDRDRVIALVEELESGHQGDQWLKAECQRIRNLIPGAPGDSREAKAWSFLRDNPIVLYIGFGLIAVLFLGLVIRRAMKKREPVRRRERGITAAGTEANEADHVREVLQQDKDLRALLLRELKSSKKALAEAHHQAREAGNADSARSILSASERIEELQNQVKFAADGEAQDFLKGKLPKENLDRLVSFQTAVSGQIKELTREAKAACDSVVAGGNPEKHLKLMRAMALEIDGKLDERKSYFGTTA